MQAISLMYHDIVEPHEHERSGFAGADAALYKLSPSQFAQHLRALAEVVQAHPDATPRTVFQPVNHRALFLTFDDGGVSAITQIADALEAHGWRGHFFVTAGWIGKAGFLNQEQIQSLHQRGHIIGSHSYSHPLRMATLSVDELQLEWRTSVARLSEIIGAQINVASIPGGQYARKIAIAAATTGITTLFTSEPVTSCHEVEGCRVYGRFTIRRTTTASVAAALASGKIVPRFQQWIGWNVRKAAKTLGGAQYLKIRQRLLSQSEGSR